MIEANESNKKILAVFSHWNTPLNTRQIGNIIIPLYKIGTKHTEKWINAIKEYLEEKYYKSPIIINIIELDE